MITRMKQYQTEDIRNIVVVGHGSEGKTTLVESMLFASGAIDRAGRVEDGNQKISMSGKVWATYGESTLTGDLAVFLNSVRTLTFPDGSVLDGPTLSGHAAYMVWDLNTNVLTGSQGVTMRWLPSSDTAEMPEKSGTQDASSD